MIEKYLVDMHSKIMTNAPLSSNILYTQEKKIYNNLSPVVNDSKNSSLPLESSDFFPQLKNNF